MAKIKVWKVTYFDPHIHTSLFGHEWRDYRNILFYSKENAKKFAKNKSGVKIEQVMVNKHEYYINK